MSKEASKRKCWFSHDWGNWEQYDTNERHPTEKYVIHIYKHQHRRCKVCNKVQYDLITII